MNTIEVLRWGQVIGLVLASGGCAYFLLLYRRVWDWYNPFARFVILLNSIVIVTAIAVVIGRVFPENSVIEFVKFLLMLGLPVVMAYQLRLLQFAKNHSDKDTARID